MKSHLRYFFICLIFLLFSSNIIAGSHQDKHLFIVSGVIVNKDNVKKIEHFLQTLEEKSGYPLKPFYVDDYSRLSQTLREHPNALAWTCGAPYVEDHIKDQQQLIAVPLFKKAPFYKSLIVTQKHNPGKSLSDFKGKIFVYSDPRSNSGYVAPSWLLKKNGIDINNFFHLKLHAGTHERSLEALYKGLANVGAIDEYIWFNYTKSKPEIAERLHVIDEIGPFPFTPIVAGSQVPKDVIKNIQDALVKLDGEGLKTLDKNFGLDGFVIKDDSFYQPIKEMMLFIGFKLHEVN